MRVPGPASLPLAPGRKCPALPRLPNCARVVSAPPSRSHEQQVPPDSLGHKSVRDWTRVEAKASSRSSSGLPPGH